MGPPASVRSPAMPGHGRSSDGILGGPIDLDGPRRRAAFPPLDADHGLVVTHAASGFVGRVSGCTETIVRVRDGAGRERVFTRAAGAFVVDGERVALRPSVNRRPRTAAPTRTASGSIASGATQARVARGSRIWVEGVHDAELVEKVWGDDLREEGVVVEQLEGADRLADQVRAFAPTAHRRLGILLDHLVDGTKEQRLAREVAGPHVLVRGHPYVDVWQAIKPGVIGLDAWPVVPKGTPWKEGICGALGWTGSTREVWTKLLRSVTTFRDLEPGLLGAVEALIDFVAPPPTD
jgi:hypothetical protein